MAGTIAVVLFGCSTPDESRRPAPAPKPDETRSTAPLRSLADLPPGRPPQLAYVVAGTSVVFPDHSVELESDVESIQGSFVWDADAGTIHQVATTGLELVASDATSAPVIDSTVTWIEGGDEIVRQYTAKERQPLADSCCDNARMVGVDFDMDPDVFLVADEGAWMWDTYEGREGLENPQPDSHHYFWRVGRLGRGSLVATGSASEVVVSYPNGGWGWGYVTARRDPASDAPVRYEERVRTSLPQVWLTSRAIIAVDHDGRLVELGSQFHDDNGGHSWRELTGKTIAFELPDGLGIEGVVAERSSDSSRRWTVLVDASDLDGRRAWVRCSLHSHACEIAAELGAEDVVPQ